MTQLSYKQAVQETAPTSHVTLTFDLLTLKVVSESRVTWATSVPFSLPRPLCSRLRPDVRDRQTYIRRASSLNAPSAGGIKIRCRDGTWATEETIRFGGNPVHVISVRTVYRRVKRYG